MILHLDLSTGASGDKLLSALLDLCEQLKLANFEELASKAFALLPEVTLVREEVLKNGISALHFDVRDEHGHVDHDHHEHEHHTHEHGDGFHTHEHDHAHGHDHDDSPHTHSHESHLSYPTKSRNWADIQKLIQDAANDEIINQNVASLATRVFTRVAEAEAKVHGVEVDEVHFHEVGAADSIIDIIFNSFLLDKLAPTAVLASPLALGNGTFFSSHGELPVPAPATAEILTGTSVLTYASHHRGELTTPTGAALIAEFVTDFAPLPCSRVKAIGHGAGTREVPGAANVVRAVAAEPASFAGLLASDEDGFFVEGVAQLECNLDHLSAEAISFACEELLAAGALDVWQESITMKKGRLATKLLLLAKPEQATELAQKTMELTGTLGVRSSYLERGVVSREVVTLDTPYGPVPFKAAAIPTGGDTSCWLRPEHDAVAELARKHGLAYPKLYKELQEIADN